MNVVYFEINNWFPGRDYPKIDFIERNINKFADDNWCKEQKICVAAMSIDMSMNYCVTAPFNWVMEKMPELLSDRNYTYDVITHGFNTKTGKVEDWTTTYHKKYSDFLRYNVDGGVESRSGCTFLDYSEDNIGVVWYDEDDFNPEYMDDEDDEN